MGRRSQLRNSRYKIGGRLSGVSRRVLCLVFLFLFLFSTAYSQLNFYESKIPEGASLQSVLDDIGERYNLEFAFDNSLKVVRFPGSEIVSDGPLQRFLEEIFDLVDIEISLSEESKVLLRAGLILGESLTYQRINISGTVTDRTGNPLPYVSIIGDSMRVNVLSDEKGKFNVLVPFEDLDKTLSFVFLGYEPFTVSIRALRSKPFVVLHEKEFKLKEITILSVPRKLEPKLIDQSYEIDASLLRNLKASGLNGGDLFRNIQLLPGIAAYDDMDASIRIRGSNSDETLFVLDGIPVFKADHYFGIFSAVNPGYVHTLQVYKNAMPIEYGGKTGGLLLINSNPIPKHFKADLDINLLTASANFQIPTGKNAGFLIGGRTSYSNINNALFSSVSNDQAIFDIPPEGFDRKLVNTIPKFRFHDMNARFLAKPLETLDIDANFFYSYDNFDNSYEAGFRSNSMAVPFFNEGIYAHLANWENLGASLNFSHKISPLWTISGSGHHARYHIEESINSSIVRQSNVDTTGISVSNTLANEVSQTGGKFIATCQKNPSRVLKIGLSADRVGSQIALKEEDNLFFDASENGLDGRLFGSYRALIGNRFSVEAGGRLLYFSEASRAYFSPQLQMTYQVKEGISFKSSLSRNHQFIRVLYLDNRFGQSRELFILSNDDLIPVGHSTNFMTGVTIKQSALSIDIEAYHKIMSGIMELALLTNGFDDTFSGPVISGDYRLFTGTGTSTGIDFLISIEKRRYTGWLAYTLSKTINRFPEIEMNGAFAAQNDRRHQLKWINTLHFGHFDVSGNYIFSSGRPYTDISNLLPTQDRRNIRSADRQSRLPDYHRLDVDLAYGFNLGKAKATAAIAVFNVTNSENVSYYQFIYNLPDADNGGVNPRNNTIVGTETNMLGRTLNLTFRLQY